jgi:hypothetical protein
MATIPFAPAAGAQRLAGAWRDALPLHLVQLELRQDAASNRVNGTLFLFGMRSVVEGPTRGDSFEIESLGGLSSAANIVRVSGRLDGDALVLTIAQKGEIPTSVRLRRMDGAPVPTESATTAPANRGSMSTLRSMASSARSVVGDMGASARSLLSREAIAPEQYAGSWEFNSDDGTYKERLELNVSGTAVGGTLTGVSRGYFSGRTTIDAALQLDGVARGDRLDLRMLNPANGAVVEVTARRRGSYLILRQGGRETGYARPGTSLVQSAEGSAEANAYLNAIGGRVFQMTSSASGKGASIGGRTRLALCANGEIAYDVSDLATANGPSFGETMDLGSSASRRGHWHVVLYAGAPAVMARWQGTGTSYSLTAYFMLRPIGDGQSVELNGTRLPATGRC